MERLSHLRRHKPRPERLSTLRSHSTPIACLLHRVCVRWTGLHLCSLAQVLPMDPLLNIGILSYFSGSFAGGALVVGLS